MTQGCYRRIAHFCVRVHLAEHFEAVDVCLEGIFVEGNEREAVRVSRVTANSHAKFMLKAFNSFHYHRGSFEGALEATVAREARH